MQKETLVGQQFGRLTVTSRSPRPRHWTCVCVCGAERSVYGPDLKTGKTKSCGCLRRELVSAAHRTHGMSRSPTYVTWTNMLARCTKATNRSYPRYGGRGVKVCPRWEKFDNFLEDMGVCPPGHTIERLDIDRGYEPDNCAWIPKAQQASNTCRTVRFEDKTLAQWARHLGRNQATIRWRLKKYGSVFLPGERGDP